MLTPVPEPRAPVPEPVEGPAPAPVPEPRAPVPEPVEGPAPAPVPAPPAPVPEPVEGPAPAPVPEPRTAVPEPVEGPGSALTRLRTAVGARLDTGRWRRPRHIIGALAALLLAGVVVGIAIPRPPEIGLSLRSGEAERRDKALEGDTYDPGSVALLDRRDRLRLWTATQGDGRVRCAILDGADEAAQKQCTPTDSLRENPYSLQVRVTPVVRADSNATQVGYTAMLFTSATGLVGGIIQRWEADARMMNQGMSDDEVAASVRIARDQHVQPPSLAGHWRGLPIWQASADNGTAQCLIIEAPDPLKVCGPNAVQQVGPNAFTIKGEEDPTQEPALVIELAATDGRPSARVELCTPMFAAPYLIITENVDIPRTRLFPSG